MSQKFSQQILSVVLNRIARGTLVPSPHTGVAQKIRKAIETRLGADLVPLLEGDPHLCASLLRVANEGVAAADRCGAIAPVVHRLGEPRIAIVVTEVLARPAVASEGPQIREQHAAIREHSLAVALVARRLSTLCRFPDAEVVYLTGLLHDIGKIIAAEVLIEAEHSLRQSRGGRWISAEQWMETVNEIHTEIANAAATRWCFPDALTQVIALCDDYDAERRVSTANFVRFANSLVQQQGVLAGPSDSERIDTMVMVGRSLLGVDDEDIIPRAIAGIGRSSAQVM